MEWSLGAEHNGTHWRLKYTPIHMFNQDSTPIWSLQDSTPPFSTCPYLLATRGSNDGKKIFYSILRVIFDRVNFIQHFTHLLFKTFPEKWLPPGLFYTKLYVWDHVIVWRLDWLFLFRIGAKWNCILVSAKNH